MCCISRIVIVVRLARGLRWREPLKSSQAVILARDNVKASVGCCVCKGGWMAGYDPTGDQATETELGEMTRPECILAAKAPAGANAASIDDSATDTHGHGDLLRGDQRAFQSFRLG